MLHIRALCYIYGLYVNIRAPCYIYGLYDYVYTTPDRSEKSNKTAFRLHSTGADLFENVIFAVATRARFLNVVERERSATRRCVNTNAVNFWCRL